MAYKSDTSLSTNTKGEIIANSITHGIGVGLSIAGLVILIIRAVKGGTGWHLAGFLVFGISLLLLYLASTIYHSFANKPWKGIFQRLDHAMIYFLIAGTYTPYLLIVSRTTLGWTIFGIIWGLSVVGLILKFVFVKRFEKPTVWLYLLMGWAGMVVFFQAGTQLSTLSIVFLLVGGAFYTVGVIFYSWKKLTYGHAIWHLFVLGGSIFHYFSVMQLV
ncbi:MAG: hemolysin III family protein [Anaerolineales bacterium]|nr:hemolysin III family protein [Anaerolineales bacterium]